MSNENWHEMHSSEITGGTYSVNGFFITAHSLADLDPDDDEPLPYAIHIHAHEYVHYLHNISTVSGLHLFLIGLYLMGMLVACTDENGHCVGDGALTDEERQWLSCLVAWIVALKGGQTWGDEGEPKLPPVKWTFEAPKRKTVQFKSAVHVTDMELASVTGKATDAKGNVFPFSIDIGYDLITEGVAYEVDREIRRENGMAERDLDQFTPPYPYVAYGELIEYLLERSSTPQERIQIGVIALQSTSPGASFVECCEELKKGLASTLSDGTFLTPALREDVCEALFKQSLEPVLAALQGSQSQEWGGNDALALFKEGFRLRIANGLLEFSFLGRPMDKLAFHSLIATMVDCCVIQATPGEKVRHEWVGPGLVAKTERDAERIGFFQSSLHYTLLHVGPSGKLHPSNRLRSSACPYSGGCQVEIDDGMPLECKTRPWTRYQDVPLGGKMCWYACGVKMLGNHTGRNSRAGDTGGVTG